MKNILITVCISILISVVSVFIYHRMTMQKAAFVKSGVIISDYKGMKLANEQFEKEFKQMQTNLDTLKNRYSALKDMELLIPPKNKTDWEYKLKIAENEYLKYEDQANQRMEAQKQQLTKKVLDEINASIQEYGKKNNYKIIFGTTDDGSILYGSESEDITDKIVEFLNNKN